MVKFIILSTQRSGSSFLGTLLSSHPDVKCFEEVFMPKNEHDISFRAYRTATLSRRMRNAFSRRNLVYQFLDELLASENTLRAVGFKFMYRQARRHPQVVDWCRSRDVRIVHLVRKNLLKIAVSRVLAKQRGVYHSKKALKANPVHLDPASLIRQLDSMAGLIRDNAARFESNPCLEVYYEDFVANKEKESQRILSFLDVSTTAPLSSDLVKINTDRLQDLIENYDTVSTALRGTPYEHMLDA